ncbi:MAG: GGDEF domain-containing protein [Thermodesulfobacteriota bacterium]
MDDSMDMHFYRKLLDSMADGVYFVDLDRRVTYWNKAAERISGYSAQEVAGKRCADNILRHVDADGRELCLQGCPLAGAMNDGKVREAEVFMHHKLGHRVPVSVRASPMRGEDGTIIGAVEVFSSNSKAINILQEIEALRREVLADQLTGIGNRRYADITLAGLETSLVEHGVPFGVLFVDIDHFKKVNDAWGHHVGDQVLRMVAQTLAHGLRGLDVACRWGGEEFVLLVPNTTAEALLGMGERLRMLVENSWLDHGEERITATASFGGAVSRPGESAPDVVDRADRQVYRSKEAGRNCVHVDAEL